MKEIIYKYFRDERILHFHSSDAYYDLGGDPYMRYQWNGYRIELGIGSNNFEEVPIKVCSTPEELEGLIKAIIY